MSWTIHIFWMMLVLLLFFIVLRRIYYFGLRANATERVPNGQNAATNGVTVYTIYDQSSAPTDRGIPPQYPEPPPPPKYDDVIKSPDAYQKPPPYTA